MPRGKKNLAESTDLKVVDSNEESGQIPYFLFDNEWGVACDERNEILVHKRIANRTIKGEDGKEDYIEQYLMWDSICYPSNFTSTLKCYIERSERKKKGKLTKSKDYNDLIKIQNDIKETISKCLDIDGINKDFLSITSILDERSLLEEQLKLLKQTKEDVENETESLMRLIKEKRSIIISNTEPKKHRTKKEED